MVSAVVVDGSVAASILVDISADVIGNIVVGSDVVFVALSKRVCLSSPQPVRAISNSPRIICIETKLQEYMKEIRRSDEERSVVLDTRACSTQELWISLEYFVLAQRHRTFEIENYFWVE